MFRLGINMQNKIVLSLLFICFLFSNLIYADFSQGLDVNKNHFNGAVTEYLINDFNRINSFSQIDAEVGRNGIDGLFVKRQNGRIVEVKIIESKYNLSKLGTTKNGKQMSEEWLLSKIKEKQNSLRKQLPNTKIQKIINDLDNVKDIIKDKDPKKLKSILFKVTPLTEEYKHLIELKRPTDEQRIRLKELSVLKEKGNYENN